MRVDICTPVGPGHARFVSEAADSIPPAFDGADSLEWTHRVRYDGQNGEPPKGRSYTRNRLAEEAHHNGADWLLWLDADDTLIPGSLEGIEDDLDGYDAVWGSIVSDGKERPGQQYPVNYDDLIERDPFLTLQVGFFVRTSVALAEPWDEGRDIGEDFDMYLRLWKSYRCKKVRRAWYNNRRFRHSTGPRAGTGRQWRSEVGTLLAVARAER